MNSVKTDVLVIGAGAAGIRAALAASEAGVDVTVVAKSPPGNSGATFSPYSKNWGYQALVGVEQTPQRTEAFYNEIIKTGLGCCDPRLVQILVEESGRCWESLRACGIRFQRNPDGRYIRVKGCFSDYPRAFITEDRTIRRVRSRILPAVQRRFVCGEAIALNVSQNVCCGAWVWIQNSDHQGELIQINSGSTILATGGGAGLFRHRLAGEHELGNGYALAHAVGASLVNLEFIQFMLAIKRAAHQSFLPLSLLRHSSRVTDSANRDLLTSAIPEAKQRDAAIALRQRHHPFSCRDGSGRIDLAIARHHRNHGPVFWNPPEEATAPARVVHCAHAFNGGVKIDAHGQSSVEGLFAAGEVAAGPHGADRIGGCMLTATQVFGRRAGKDAARHSGRRAFPVVIPTAIADLMQQTDCAGGGGALEELIQDISHFFSQELGIIRNGKGLRDCLEVIVLAQGEILAGGDGRRIDRLRAYNTLSSMHLITTAALKRTESLGPHFREDHPPKMWQTDPEYVPV